MKNVSLYQNKGRNQQNGYPDGHVVMKYGCDKKLDSAKSKPELSAFTLEAGNVPKNDKNMK